MTQLFKRRSNSVYRLTLLILFSLAGGAFTFGIIYKWSPYETEVGVPFMQPIPFSHKHHVSGLGLDCRYCHSSVETTATAGIPPTKTCMTCHSQIWQEAPILQPVRDSFKYHQPIHWNRVYRIPQYVYFNHSIHIHKGIGCTTCHGAIHEMPLTWKVKPFFMKDCLACHREPEKYIRPRDQVFNVRWKTPEDQITKGKQLVQEYHIPKERLTDCYTCHR